MTSITPAAHVADRPVLADLFHGPYPLRWTPVPSARDRSAWSGVPAAVRERVAGFAAADLGAPWTALPASLFARFERAGDRASYEQPYFARRHRLAWAVLAAAVAPDHAALPRERLLADIVDGVWLLCEESTWCLPAHDPRTYLEGHPLPDPRHPQIDLFAAETGALLTLLDGILAADLDDWDPVLRRRIHQRIRARVLRPYLERTDLGWYDGSTVPANNWNPWIHSNVLLTALRHAASEDELDALVRRVLRGLDNYLAGQPTDGGCDEGPRYWWRAGASLFECLETLSAASGDDRGVFAHPLTKAMARYPVTSYLGDGWVVNFADSPARGDIPHPGLLHRFGRRTRSAQVIAHAQALRGDTDPALPPYGGVNLRRVLDDLLDARWLRAEPADFPLPAHTWLADTEILVSRTRAGSTEGLLLAAKGGHNDESHNHNDVGSFIVALDGHPLVVDAGVGTYRRETFSPVDRYTIWTMRSAYHNLPLVNGTEQAAGPEHRSRQAHCELAEDADEFGLDLAAAYPAAARLRTWRRTFRLDRAGQVITVHDAWRTEETPSALALHLLLSGEVDITGPGSAVVPAGEARLALRWDPAAFDAHDEAVAVEDPQISKVWGPRLHRLVLTCRTPRAVGSHTLTFSRAD